MEGGKVDTTVREAQANTELPKAVASAASPTVEKFLVAADEEPEVGVIKGTELSEENTESPKDVISVANPSVEESPVQDKADDEPQAEEEEDPYESSATYFIRMWVNGVLIVFSLLVMYAIGKYNGVNLTSVWSILNSKKLMKEFTDSTGQEASSICGSFLSAMAALTFVTIFQFMNNLWKGLEALNREKKIK